MLSDFRVEFYMFNAQDCSNPITNALELPQTCVYKPSEVHLQKFYICVLRIMCLKQFMTFEQVPFELCFVYTG